MKRLLWLFLILILAMPVAAKDTGGDNDTIYLREDGTDDANWPVFTSMIDVWNNADSGFGSYDSIKTGDSLIILIDEDWDAPDDIGTGYDWDGTTLLNGPVVVKAIGPARWSGGRTIPRRRTRPTS